MSKKRVLIAAGGTGGHIFPAASLGKELLDNHVEVKFAGGGLANNKYFDRTQFSFEEITCGFLSTKNPFNLMRGIFRVGKGIVEGRKLLKQYCPDIVVGFGSFYTFPILSAAKLASIPVILHEQNAMPGRVNRLLSPYVDFTAVSIPDASKSLSGKVIPVEMPLKLKNHPSKRESRDYFQLNDEKETILVFGGSQGSDAINNAFLDCVSSLDNVQVIHFTGNAERTRLAKEIYKKYGIPACVKDFETRMDYAWSAADLAITRSGASTVAEAMEYEVPLIMIPFPQAMDNHQEYNADFMMDSVKGGVKILEGMLNPTFLCSTIKSFRTDAMKQAISEYRSHSNTQSLTALVLNRILN